MATGNASGSRIRRRIPGFFILLVLLAAHPSVLLGQPQGSTVKLIFIHHSCGQNWLADENGGLGIALRDNNYFVSDTNYGWGPQAIGDHTDIGNWYDWFVGPNHATYLDALYAESGQNSDYSRLDVDPGGANTIIMFKSCFPNSNLGGTPNDPATSGENPLRGQDSGSQFMTVGNAKGIYEDLPSYFASHQEKLFIVITAPPLSSAETDSVRASNARAFNNWLVSSWLAQYPYHNVAVFDFYNVLTSNGGNANTNDLWLESGNHHRLWNGAIQHIQTVNNNVSAYPSDLYDSHPTSAGNQKATSEFVGLLNTVYDLWYAHGLWHEGTVLQNGWYWINWFGFFNNNSSPWVYHQTLGWLYPAGTSTDSIWFYDPQWNGTGGWWWTSSSLFPWIYSVTGNEWLYYDANASGGRWFANSGGQWTTH